jgi:hypothetical protein
VAPFWRRSGLYQRRPDSRASRDTTPGARRDGRVGRAAGVTFAGGQRRRRCTTNSSARSVHGRVTDRARDQLVAWRATRSGAFRFRLAGDRHTLSRSCAATPTRELPRATGTRAAGARRRGDTSVAEHLLNGSQISGRHSGDEGFKRLAALAGIGRLGRGRGARADRRGIVVPVLVADADSSSLTLRLLRAGDEVRAEARPRTRRSRGARDRGGRARGPRTRSAPASCTAASAPARGPRRLRGRHRAARAGRLAPLINWQRSPRSAAGCPAQSRRLPRSAGLDVLVFHRRGRRARVRPRRIALSREVKGDGLRCCCGLIHSPFSAMQRISAHDQDRAHRVQGRAQRLDPRGAVAAREVAFGLISSPALAVKPMWKCGRRSDHTLGAPSCRGRLTRSRPEIGWRSRMAAIARRGRLKSHRARPTALDPHLGGRLAPRVKTLTL